MSVEDAYSITSGACRDVIAYYTDLAPQHGWQMTRTFTSSVGQTVSLLTFFEKPVDVYTLEMTIECRDSEGVYYLSIDT